ncbi:MAG: hypothetical protein ACLSHP_13660 [Coprococcus sp.]
MSELLKSMTTRVVGVSFDNDDGTSRQDIISGLSVGEALLLNYHEYENEPVERVTRCSETASTCRRKNWLRQSIRNIDCYFAVSVDDINGDPGLNMSAISRYIAIPPETNENEYSSTAATVVDADSCSCSKRRIKQNESCIVQCFLPLSVLCLSSLVLFYCWFVPL